MEANERRSSQPRERSSSTGSSSGEWSDSSCSSFCSDSDSYLPEWDSFVRDDGELVYVITKSESEQADRSEKNATMPERGGFTRQSVRRSSKGMWLKILKRRNSTRAPKSSDAHSKKSNPSTVDSKVTFSENRKGEIKIVTLDVDFSNKTRFGRKNDLTESTLGITTATFGDGKNLMVSGVVPDTPAADQKQIKIGDWLKEIDDGPVDLDNIDRVLGRYSGSGVGVKLTLQRIAGAEVENPVPDSSRAADLTKHLTDETDEHEIVVGQALRDSPVSVVYLATRGLTENGPENEGVFYCYPRPEKFNFLCSSKGTFITLNHLLPEVFKNSKPLTCSVTVKETEVNVTFTTAENDHLLLLALPENKCDSFQLSRINAQIVKCLELCYKSLNDCFVHAKNTKKLDYFFSRLFSQILTCGYGWESRQSTRVENILLSTDVISEPLFEQCLPVAQTVNLPWEARLQIDDVLTELDATCISTSDDNVEPQDVFHIIGTCAYYSGHLLTTHMLQTEHSAIHSFLKLQGFLSISLLGNVKNLIVWKEIYLSNLSASDNEESDTSDCFKVLDTYNRTFMIIIGRGHFLLVTVVRGTQTAKYVPPSPYFIEECESTIELLIEVGLDNFLEQWFTANLQPQVVLEPERFLSSMKKDIGGFAGFGKKSSPVSKKSPEIQSILKKRQTLTEMNYNANESNANNSGSSQSPSLYSGNAQIPRGTHQTNRSNLSYPDSDDSYSENSASEISEERIQGRRAIRDKETNLSRNSLSSDSYTEWDGCEANSQVSGSFELTDLSQSLLQKMGGLLPTKITAGNENVCFHFVRLENELGILLAPTMNVQTNTRNGLYKHILKNFRKAAQKIHTVLQNTLRYKKMLSPSSSVNKSLVAIKEYGILFETPSDVLESVLSLKKNEDTFTYWVIGRLFEQPKFAEVYICCHESVPQNMIEIAFRLAFDM